MGREKMMIERPKRSSSYTDLRRANRVSERRAGHPADRVESSSSLSSEVHVSDRALLFIEMKKRLQALPDIRADRLEIVRRKLLDGVYQVPVEEALDKRI